MITQGKWKVVYIDENETAVYVPGHKIATLTHPHWDDEAKANAYLIAAAPELLEACKEAVKLIDIARQYFPKSIKRSNKFTLESTCATIGKAIAKTEGK